MNINEFREKVIANIVNSGDIAKDVTLETVDVAKFNDQMLHGIIFRKESEMAAPTLYVDDLYERMSLFADISEDDCKTAAESLVDSYMTSLEMLKPPQMEIPSWETARNNLSLRLCEAERNKEFLKNAVYKEIGSGLALVADICMNGCLDWRAIITKDLISTLGVDEEELFEKAMATSMSEPFLGSLEALAYGAGDNLFEAGELPADTPYVLTNEDGMYGAASIGLRGIPEKICDLIREDVFYILPSSVHEVILMPAACVSSVDDVKRMVWDANRSVVEPKDVLSDNVYKYTLGKGLEIA